MICLKICPFEHEYGGPSLPIKEIIIIIIIIKRSKIKNENKKIYSEEKPTQLSWLMSGKPDT